jgi:acetolactate synthase-1/2/3 large subunit
MIWVIFDNGEFNIIKQFLLNLFGEAPFMKVRNPDYVAYAQACGARGFRVENVEELGDAFGEALKMHEPVLIDAVVDPDARPPFSAKGI